MTDTHDDFMDNQKMIMPSGGIIDPFNLTVDSEFTIHDIAIKLSRIYRFAGLSSQTVAEHCCEVAKHLFINTQSKDMALYGLLHDSFEAFTFDVPRPQKKHLYYMFSRPNELPHYEPYSEIEKRALGTIYKKFGLRYRRTPRLIKDVDNLFNRREWEKLYKHEHTDSHMTSKQAEKEFIKLYKQWGDV